MFFYHSLTIIYIKMYRNIVYLMIASVIIIHLLLSRQVLGLYETIWNAYYERPCCEKEFMNYHKGKMKR